MQYDDKIDIYYLRLSKEDGDSEKGTIEESCSISSQRVLIHRFLQINGMNPDEFEEIVDDGYTGTNMKRPGMRRIVELVKQNKVRTLVVKDLSRFSRDYLQAGHYLEIVFPTYKVRFISVNDRFDSKLIGETTGGLELAIQNLINTWYSKQLSKSIKSVVHDKKMNGEFVYGTAPYGYKKGEKRNTIVIDHNVAHIVQNIFEWAASGITITNIARMLNEQKVTTPSVYLVSVRGKYKTYQYWSYESVRNILLNRIYTGDTVPYKSHVVRVGSDRVKMIPEELQIVIPCTHEAIISRSLYYQAREVVKTHKKTRQIGCNYNFTSLLFCGCCGNRLLRGKRQNKSWRCVTHRYTDNTDCGKVVVNDAELEQIVVRAVNTQCELLDIKISQLKKSSNITKNKEQIMKNECRSLRLKIEHAETKTLRFYEDYVEGRITKEDFIATKNKNGNETEQLKLQLTVAERKLKELQEELRESKNQILDSKMVMRHQEIQNLTPELAKELIKRITIYPDGKIHIEWNFSDGLSSLMDVQSELVYKAV